MDWIEKLLYITVLHKEIYTHKHVVLDKHDWLVFDANFSNITAIVWRSK